MSEIKHTVEPWRYSQGLGHYEDEIVIYADGMSERSPLARISNICGDAEGDARRIVACVNELAELTTEQIEDGAFKKMRDDRDFLRAELEVWKNRCIKEANHSVRLERERDELLSALKDASACLTGKAAERASAAIAKAEGKL